ncbi:hypothetical protein S245_065645, partial [Arachis hypogaea]
GSTTIETIYLDLTQQTEICISSNAFRKMPNLRLLAFASNNGYGQKRVDYTLSLPTNLELPNNLRYIQWDGCPLKNLCQPLLGLASLLNSPCHTVMLKSFGMGH